MALFDRIRDLVVDVEAARLEPFALEIPGKFTRLSTVIELAGAGHVGRGEDTTYSARDQELLREAGPAGPLSGRFTLEEFSAHLETLELWPQPPEHDMYLDYRRWAYESAALELALAQAGVGLGDLVDREPRPARFVVSTPLGSPPSLERLEELLAFESRLRFKLDTSNDWDEELVAALAELGRVDVVDFKGAYSGTIVDQAPDPALYRRVVAGLPGVLLEDPHRTPEVAAELEGHWERVTWDAPIHRVADVAALEHRPRTINVKPSRCGTLERLFGLYEYCETEGIAMYGGGQFELADGRRQIQELAGLFHPDGPNDVAPSEFNRPTLAGPIDDARVRYAADRTDGTR